MDRSNSWYDCLAGAVVFTVSSGLGCSGSAAAIADDVSDPVADGFEPRSSDPVADGFEPGSIQLQCMGSCSVSTEGNGAKRLDASGSFGRLHQAQSSSIAFEMGAIRASRDFLFLLVNPGDTAVTGISLISSNPSFKIEPSSIDRLPPQKDAVVIPVIRVSAEHGISVGGVGTVDLLPMGENTTTVEILGSSVDADSQAHTVEFVGDVRLTAQVMDVELFAGTQRVDLATPPHTGSSSVGGLGFISGYDVGSAPSIVNTGNVDIDVSLRTSYALTAQTSWLLAIGATLVLPFVPNSDTQGNVVGLQSNTVCDGSRFQVGNDGAAYFTLQ
jgi:hypothetical protein